MLVDYHMHLRAPGSEELDHTAEGVERYVERAGERGVDEIGITEHVYYFRETRGFWALPYQLERSRATADELQQVHEVRRGAAHGAAVATRAEVQVTEQGAVTGETRARSSTATPPVPLAAASTA